MEIAMVQFVATAGFSADIRFFFNLTRPVGRGYPNAPADDVSFVQLCFAAGAPGADESAEIKRVWGKVKVTGRMDGETQAAIDVWQAYRKTLFRRYDADGIISVAPPSAFYARNTPYEILVLNWILLVAARTVWPRVEKDPHCTPLLGRAIRTTLGVL
jgi:hypothetical protein